MAGPFSSEGSMLLYRRNKVLEPLSSVGMTLFNPFTAGGAERRPLGRPRMSPFGDISNYCFYLKE